MRAAGCLTLVILLGCGDDGRERAEVADSGPHSTDGRGGCAPVEERCNGVDDDCDGRTDEGTRNACGQCGATPLESCNGLDDDCDHEIDEGVLNACGACGLVPAEVCNGEDEDCDGATDEGVLNPCGACGPAPAEVCNGADDDCDGEADEGVLNACGACGAVPAEVCDGADDDCDGETDEGVGNACGGCGAVPEEVCDFADNDCDGRVDEGLRNACGACAQVADERCNGMDDDCDGSTDEGVLNACARCGAAPEERCNFLDDDCDGVVDEGGPLDAPGGLRNACGECGVVVELCNGVDDDCDGRTDEALLNACGRCGDLPVEVCNGVDDDCDGDTDEGLRLNRCGVPCVEEPVEVCNGVDDDCDGGVDEDLFVNACGECGPVPHEVCDAADNDCDGAVDEDFELNACGACGQAPAEVCNGEDEDCDGRADEDFRVGRSVDHCGGCGDACPRDNASPECIGGRCVLVACDAGFRDENREVEDGCEVEVVLEAERVVVFVDAAAPAGGDGTVDRPFQTIIDALADVRPETRVVVGPGVYEGVLEVSVVGVLVDAGADVVVRPGADEADAAAVVEISADHATVSGLQIDAGNLVYKGIALTCEAGCGAVDNEIIRVGGGGASQAADGILVDGGDGVRVVANYVAGVTSTGEGQHLAAGIRVVGGRAVVSRNHVVDVHSSDPDAGSGAPAGRAVGIHLVRASDTTLASNSVREVGPGTNALLAGRLVPGAEAIGLLVDRTNGVSIDGAGADREDEPAAVRSLRGGLAREGPNNRAGRPGAALGLLVVDSAEVVVTGLRIDDLLGGTGGGADGHLGGGGGTSAGVRLERVQGFRATAMTIDLPAGALGGVDSPRGLTYGYELLADLDGVLIDSTNRVNGEPAYVAMGVDEQVEVVGLRMREPVVISNRGQIVLIDVDAPLVADNHVIGPVAGAGDAAVGINLAGITGGAVVRDNLVEDLVGGLRRGRGGDATGIRLSDIEGRAVVAGNTIRNLTGGREVSFVQFNGLASAVSFDLGVLVASNNLVAHLVGRGSRGFSVGRSSFAFITRGSFYAFERTSGDERAAGVYVDPGIPNRAPVVVQDSIFESMDVSVMAARLEAEVDYVALRHVAEAPLEENFGPNVLRLDRSCFVLAGLDDFALRPGSPCVDAGDGARGCGEEPGGEGCVPDLGHLAGTEHARP